MFSNELNYPYSNKRKLVDRMDWQSNNLANNSIRKQLKKRKTKKNLN